MAFAMPVKLYIKEPWFTRVVKPLIFVFALLPLVWLVIGMQLNRLGANPVETLIQQTGDWALRFLLLSLAFSPIKRRLGWGQGIRLRRMIGLFAFFYAVLHFLLYLGFELAFDWQALWDDVQERPFILVGMLAFVGLIPLAATSTKSMIKRLGKSWIRLHQSVYVIALLAVLHFWWMKASKGDVSEPLLYAVILALLLLERLLWFWQNKRPLKPL